MYDLCTFEEMEVCYLRQYCVYLYIFSSVLKTERKKNLNTLKIPPLPKNPPPPPPQSQVSSYKE
jgi:hypothetical protein